MYYSYEQLGTHVVQPVTPKNMKQELVRMSDYHPSYVASNLRIQILNQFSKIFFHKKKKIVDCSRFLVQKSLYLLTYFPKTLVIFSQHNFHPSCMGRTVNDMQLFFRKQLLLLLLFLLLLLLLYSNQFVSFGSQYISRLMKQSDQINSAIS